MAIKHPHFREHLSFLREGGALLARAYPRVAGLLAGVGLDPDAERLLEGIAFIASKITEKQQLGLDEVCQSLFDVLFPHYLCSIPATSIVELSQQPEAAPIVLPRGTEVQSLPGLGTVCRFRLAYEVALEGLQIEEVVWQPSSGTSALTVRFFAPRWLAQPPQRDRIRLHLHGEPLLTRSLYEWLLRRCERVELLDQRGRPLAVPDIVPAPVGYAADQALLDVPVGTFGGFRILQEYFTLPQKFLFVDLDGVWAQLQRSGGTGGERFSLRLVLRASGGSSLAVTHNNVRLGCSPVVNLFEHPADPIARDPGRVDYRVRPSGPHLHYDTVRVLSVAGYLRGRRQTDYPLLADLDLHHADGAFGQLRRRFFEGELQTYLSVYDPPGSLPKEETLIIDLLCSNGYLPTALGVGDIAVIDDVVAGLRCTNLLPPTRPLPPPLGHELRRRLVRHIVLSRRELTSIPALRDLVHLYDFRVLYSASARRAQDQLLAAFLGVQQQEMQQRCVGAPAWGRSTVLTMDDSAFTTGEDFLFGCMLNEVVALQSPVNVFSEFALRRARTQDVHRWPKRLGPDLLGRC